MASRSVNKVFLIGHLGRDAETRFTPSGVACTRFSVATTRSWKDQQTEEWKEETNWTNVTAWRKEKFGQLPHQREAGTRRRPAAVAQLR